jgi:pimeloyl-ACP methyl ester carboxylesterase
MRPTLFGPAADPELVARARTWGVGQDPARLAAAMRALRDRPDTRAAVEALDCPVVVGVGAEDAAVTVPESTSLADAARLGRLDVFEGSGHLPNLEASEQFDSVLTGILSELETARRPSELTRGAP